MERNTVFFRSIKAGKLIKGRVILLEWRNESGRKLTLACNPMDALWEKFLPLPFHLSFRQDVFEWKSFRFRETELLRRRNEILTFIETDNIVLYSNHYPLDYLKKKKKSNNNNFRVEYNIWVINRFDARMLLKLIQHFWNYINFIYIVHFNETKYYHSKWFGILFCTRNKDCIFLIHLKLHNSTLKKKERHVDLPTSSVRFKKKKINSNHSRL